jgi:hypothetical protein
MIYTEEELNTFTMKTLYEEFIKTYNRFHSLNLIKLKEIESDKSLVKAFKQQFNYLKKSNYCNIYKVFTYPQFEKFNTEEFKKYLYTMLGKKIRGLFKHGQSAKTEISCDKIVFDLKKGFMTIAITKNTLLANKQWTTRCIKIMKKCGLNNLKNEILVISSKFNDLNGNATHCKSLTDAWSEICDKNNKFKVIFVCGNKIRVNDVCKLLFKYNQESFNSSILKKLVIQYDEAHNDMCGLPTCREYIENMLLYDFVEEFIPITASNKPIHDFEKINPLWIEENINSNKLNYINPELAKSRIKSDDVGYSSIQDATHIIIDEVYDDKSYDNIIHPELFRKHYPDKDYSRLGHTNSCPIVLCGDEELVLNKAKKILDNQDISFEISNGENDNEIINEKIFKKDEANFHIMITPCRTVITEMIMVYARDRDFSPVVIGLYGSQIHYKYSNEENKKKFGTIPNDNDSKEFNEILYEWLRRKNLTNRCVIIVGNYYSVGESNTFVNSDYGYLRSGILLPGCNLNPEKHYQFLLRICFLLEKFHGLTKYNVTKFIIGYKQGINDAVEYEKINDEIVQDLIDNPEESEISLEYCTSGIGTNGESTTQTIRQTIPVQCKIEDESCEYVKNMRVIMGKETNNRTSEEKKEFMINLIKAINESSIIIDDKNSPNIKLEEFTLKEFRCYKDGYNPDNYRFKGYYDKWFLGQKYNNGELKSGECGIYSCLKKHKSTINGEHINNPNTFYLSFAY